MLGRLDCKVSQIILAQVAAKGSRLEIDKAWFEQSFIKLVLHSHARLVVKALVVQLHCQIVVLQFGRERLVAQGSHAFAVRLRQALPKHTSVERFLAREPLVDPAVLELALKSLLRLDGQVLRAAASLKSLQHLLLMLLMQAIEGSDLPRGRPIESELPMQPGVLNGALSIVPRVKRLRQTQILNLIADFFALQILAVVDFEEHFALTCHEAQFASAAGLSLQKSLSC